MTRVLVFDAENKNALAAIRSLGRHGIEVISGSTRRLGRGRLSRYSTRHIVYPSPEDEQGFVGSVLDAIGRFDIDVLLPIGDVTTRTLSRHRQAVHGRAALPVADWEVMRIACSKSETMPFADRVGIPIPRTFAHKREVSHFPVVVKPSSGTGTVRYVNTSAELGRIDISGDIVQDYIPGEGFGFFALFEHGKERAIFMHRRIREYPVTGGPSAAAESFYDERLKELGLTLLRALDWHGVAMVEFKRDARDSEYKLMEINPKFWGSLDLSIAAGVDFPWLAVQMALGQLDHDTMSYPTGLRFQWVFDEVMHLAARPSAFREVIADFRTGVRNDLRSDDPWPAVYDGARTIAALLIAAVRGQLRHPHGIAKQAPPSVDR